MSYAKDAPALCEVVEGVEYGCNGNCSDTDCDCTWRDRRGREWWIRVDPFTGIAFSFPMRLIPEGPAGGSYEDAALTLLHMAEIIGATPPAPRPRPFKLRDIREAVRDLRRAAIMPQQVGYRRYAFMMPIHPKALAVLLSKTKPRSRSKKRKSR